MSSSYGLISDVKSLNQTNDSTQQEQMSGDTFWKKLEEEKAVTIPSYIKNIFRLNNLDNPLSFQCINDDSLAELEEFARDSMRDILKRGESLELYYGRYQKMTDKFRFLIGDKFLIKKLVAFVAEKPDEYWRVSIPPPPILFTPQSMPVTPFNQVFIKNNLDIEPDDQKLQPVDQVVECQMEIPNKNEGENKPDNIAEDLENRLRIKEIENLVRLVKYSLCRELKSKPNFRQWLKNINVKVAVSQLQNGNQSEITYVVSALVKCVICDLATTIRKTVTPGINEPRWIISNYKRHIKSHFKIKKKTPEIVGFDIDKAGTYSTFVFTNDKKKDSKKNASGVAINYDFSSPSTSFEQNSFDVSTDRDSANSIDNETEEYENEIEERDNQEEEDHNEVSYTVSW